MNMVRVLAKTAAAVSAALLLGLGATSALTATATTEDTLRLHLGSDGTSFVHSNGGDPITQTIAPPQNCLITVEGPLAAISGSDSGPGLKDGSIGIKTGGSTGVPCGRTDATEELTVTLLNVPEAVRASLDLELKGGPRVEVVAYLGDTVVEAFEVRAGKGIIRGQGTDGSAVAPYTATATVTEPIVNCRNASDSGPDAGALDNCYVTIDPGAAFDSLKITPSRGEVSLEGSSDFGNDPAFDTVFYLGEEGGELGCTPETGTATIDRGNVYGTFTRLENPDGTDCVLKPYTLTADIEAETLSFVPVNTDPPQLAAYQGTVKFAPEDAANPFTSQLEYDQDDDGPLPFEFMPWCTGDPFAAPGAPGSIDTSVIPSGHTWCIVSETTSVYSATQTRTAWDVVGLGDPKMR
jgi:hypothetical protein